MEEAHDCGKFDKSYIEIKKSNADWIIWIGGDPEIAADYCPYCGKELASVTTQQ